MIWFLRQEFTKKVITRITPAILPAPLISDTIIKKIKNAFLSSIFINPYINYAELLQSTMQNIYPDTLVTAFFYKPILERQATFLASSQKNYFITHQHISKNGYDSVNYLVWQKNYQQTLLEYTYGVNSKIRDSMITGSNKYYDSLIEAKLFRDGSNLSTTQFAIALKYKKFLELRSTLTDTLLWHAMFLKSIEDSIKLKEPFAKPDFKEYEAKWMNELLSSEQYSKLLKIQFSPVAQADAEQDWNDMEIWNCSKGFSKEETVESLFRYRLGQLMAYYRLAHDRIQQEINQKALTELEPKALKILTVAKKSSNPLNNNSNTQVKW